MNLLRSLIRPYLFARYGFHRLTGTGSFRCGRRRFVQNEPDPAWPALKQALWRCHVSQFHESSCSVASVVTCINAIRQVQGNPSPPVTQHEILDRVTTGHWKERMQPGGYRGRRGLPLPLLARVVEDSLTAYRLDHKGVTFVHTPPKTPVHSPVRTRLRQRLRNFDRCGDGLVIAHFDQGTLVPTLNIPHISPVGGFDAASGAVTMLDVDPEEPRFYQVPFEAFFEAVSTDYHQVFRAFGYGSGGYVYIRLA